MAALADIVFDCARPASLARFWASALDGYQVAPYDNAELARLHSIGITDVEDDPTVLVEPSVSDGPRLWFQRVPEPKHVKNQVHLDLRADDVDEELDRLVGLGAHVFDDQASEDVVILQDPEGNEFCLLRPGAGDRGRASAGYWTSLEDTSGCRPETAGGAMGSGAPRRHPPAKRPERRS